MIGEVSFGNCATFSCQMSESLPCDVSVAYFNVISIINQILSCLSKHLVVLRVYQKLDNRLPNSNGWREYPRVGY